MVDRELLQRLAGPDARFREHQREAITDLVEDRARVLCVQRTGWGKSAVYFLATTLLREQGAGPALIVSPLLALMRNQIAAAEKLGIRAHTINSTNRDDWAEVRDLLEQDAVDLLLISPERLNNPQFRNTMLPLFAERVGLLVIDEAHCISDWGHDFRPDYRRIQDMLEQLPAGVAVLCTTATANDRVVADITEQLALGHAGALRTYRGPLSRASLRLEVVEMPAPADRLAWLATHLPQLPGSGIVYTLTKRDADLVAELLNAHGVPAAGLQRRGGHHDADRDRGEAAPQRAQVRRRHQRARHGLRQARPRLRRALPGARLGDLLLPAGRPRGARDRPRRRRAAARRARTAGSRTSSSSRRSRRRTASTRVLEALEDGGATTNELMGAVNLGKGRIEAMLKVLDVEGAVSRNGTRWTRVNPAATGSTTATATPTSPRCAGASRRRWPRSAPTGAA